MDGAPTMDDPGYPVFDAQKQQDRLQPSTARSSASSTYFYRSTGGSGLEADAGRRLAPGRHAPRPRCSTAVRSTSSCGASAARSTVSSTASRCLRHAAKTPTKPDTSLWNGKLLYWFQGGVAIGHSQGTIHGGSMNPDILGQGYAIAHSSGNNTGTHYNLQLAGETAMMTKEALRQALRRAELHRRPRRLGRRRSSSTSCAQNHPGVLDAALPVQSLPRHGDADHPRRRLRTARALHGRHRPRQRQVDA